MMHDTPPPPGALRIIACATILFIASGTHAGEGMFMPGQLASMADELERAGLELDAKSLTRLTDFPMGAIISLGGCTASFVSPEGLVVTNHHCARGSVQYNSTPEHNYLQDGFLAATRDEELRTAPGTRIFVTTDVQDVTSQVLDGLAPELAPRDRFDQIEQRRKELVKSCESDPGYRCRVATFFGGLEYQLIKRLEIRDVRIVYSPSDAIGAFGGDIDNWQWPRHTGDFAFYRAYVSADGTPADYAPENRPFRPRHHLEVSSGGLEAGDFVMVMGYPGSTSRYARHARVKHTFEWNYPQQASLLREWIGVIEAAAPAGSEARILYESRLAGLNNYLKNTEGQIEGARKSGLITRRAARDERLAQWLASDPDAASLASAVTALDALVTEAGEEERQRHWLENATRSQLLGVAEELYRLAQERQKPDAEREPGYQDRDLRFVRERLARLERRYHPDVDKAEWQHFLSAYLAQPAQNQSSDLNTAMGLHNKLDAAELSSLLDSYYQRTQLDQAHIRASLMDASLAALESSDDPFMQLAVALYPSTIAHEEIEEARAGRRSLLEPAYMQAIIAWQESGGHTAYPDANSTLRVTYGRVMGGSPRDGLIYEPFTRLEGILHKHRGEHPFDAPSVQLDQIRAGQYGDYALESLGSVAVNFLSDLDSTGGNSGSPTVNGRGELVGLLFDGTLESVNSDWDFDARITRSIHVDSRYMLWVMEYVDGATALVDEMTLVP